MAPIDIVRSTLFQAGSADGTTSEYNVEDGKAAVLK